MSNAALAAVLLTLAIVPLAPAQTVATPRPPVPPCPNAIVREPLVSFESTGGTLLGPVDIALAVFNDGSARLSSAFGGTGPGSSQLVYLDPAETEALRDGLVALGALARCDVPDLVSDTPLQTLTVHRAATTKRSNTFSWFQDDDDLLAMRALIDDFIAAHFAPLPGGGGS
jgi:hypothetical protein